jgi:hypothetical protein
MLGKFKLKGTVISKKQEPIKNLKIEAFDDDPIIDVDDLLGQRDTDVDGSFEISFDDSVFSNFWELLERTPDVYLIVIDENGKKQTRSKVAQTKYEIQYQMRMHNTIPDPRAEDPYAGNAGRMISMLSEVGNLLGIENRINLDLLNHGDPPVEIKNKLRNYVSGHDERVKNFDHFMAILSGVTNSFLEELHIGTIGYDGPQVPRIPRREAYNQFIIWPRKEEFKWA